MVTAVDTGANESSQSSEVSAQPGYGTVFTGAIDGDVTDAGNWDNGLPTAASGNIGLIDNYGAGVFGNPSGYNIVVLDTDWATLNTSGDFRPANGSVTVGNGATFGPNYNGKFQPTGNWHYIVDGGTMMLTSGYIGGALSGWVKTS